VENQDASGDIVVSTFDKGTSQIIYDSSLQKCCSSSSLSFE
jgi:hypothetical protein